MRVKQDNNSRASKKALLVVTSHTELDDTGQKTGFWFDELATPFWGLYDAGYEVCIASIKGGKASADPLSAQGEFATPAVKRFLASDFAMSLLDDTLLIDEVNVTPFTTLFLCGGHGTLWDFKQSRGLARVVSEFYAAQKLIAGVCHGPTGLLSAKKPDGSALVTGLKLTAFSDAEETLTPPQYIEALPYHLEDALVEQGANYQCGQPNAQFVRSEKGLITGQNPASVALVTKTLLDALSKKRVWVDTNLAIGTANEAGQSCKIDNAYALLSLFNSSNVKVQGISSVFGETDTLTASQLAKMLANRFGPVALPVATGAAQALNISEVKSNQAVERLAQSLRQEPMTLVALGPLTNIATLILLYPELTNKIEQLIWVAGRASEHSAFIAGPKQQTPFADMGFELDVDAARVVLASDIPVVLTPFELASQVCVTQADVTALEESHGVGEYLAEHSQPWLNRWTQDYGAQGFSPIAALAAGFAINPNRYQWQKLAVEFRIAADDTKGARFGTPEQYKPYLIASPECQSPYSVLYCTHVVGDFKQSLLSRIINPNDPAKYIAAVSHLNIIVDDVDEATAFYQRTLGFEQAYDEAGEIMDYPHLTLASFAKDAGFSNGKVDVDIRFLRHPTAGLYLELMRYYTPKGEQTITKKNTHDMGGVRHTALEVNDIMEAFNYLKDQPGVEMVRYPDGHEDDEQGPPMVLAPFPMSFFYWRDQYGVQWEMECGRKRGYLRGI
ncbi:nucleoside hydrolase [Motilimonas sp. KMU-193]|uniref:nucleoside hydrolase n=1 Tax=Motilimonas sp. KMU-193 TaxID=3388668 RepID=UPI00396AFE48